VLLTALLSAVFTLGLDRGIAALQVQATPTATITGPPPQVIVQLDSPTPRAAPPALPADEQARLLQELSQQADQQQGMTFVGTTIWQISFALEALSVNDMGQADRELVAAKASLDEAFRLVAENLKPQIDTERLEVGRLRATLEINPSGLDEDLRRLRQRLISLVAARPS
jgi:hypothetical protein